MGNYVMTHDDIPEVTFGDGRRKISFKGKEAIRAAGRGIRFMLFAEATKKLAYGGIGLLLLKWLLSLLHAVGP
jgi:hypothetical protein